MLCCRQLFEEAFVLPVLKKKTELCAIKLNLRKEIETTQKMIICKMEVNFRSHNKNEVLKLMFYLHSIAVFITIATEPLQTKQN